MRKSAALVLAGIFGIVVMSAAPAQTQRTPAPNTLRGKIAFTTKLTEEDVDKVLKAMGPIIRDSLASGQTVDLTGLGQFRVVRVDAHQDLINGRPATVAATNTVEFLPVGELVESANARGARPAETVPAFEYNPIPGQTRALKTGSTRAPNSRTR